ncbi:uncharacterized protein LY89DRAFT_782686 [Mollisia scopiformis]|uniref:Uncharacterized protein n=1 Tax=Mollisia scopiformis TaxID=149040 RepID=A0A194X8D2_MOLSC|nr:uncharacterized protein LY89DRAFT_782686 [Mollisia scopiformis]KUJ16426.1 hypothetical protein LY89DRAFT_782686 [Mollisia scopiformis]
MSQPFTPPRLDQKIGFGFILGDQHLRTRPGPSATAFDEAEDTDEATERKKKAAAKVKKAVAKSKKHVVKVKKARVPRVRVKKSITTKKKTTAPKRKASTKVATKVPDKKRKAPSGVEDGPRKKAKK